MPRNFNNIRAKTILSGIEEISEFNDIQRELQVGMTVKKNNKIYIYSGNVNVGENGWVDDDSQYLSYDTTNNKIKFENVGNLNNISGYLTIDNSGYINVTSNNYTSNINILSNNTVSKNNVGEYSGYIHQIETIDNIFAGQPVIFDYNNNKLKIKSITTNLNNNHKFAGISINNYLSGEIANILYKGITSVRKKSEFININYKKYDISFNNTNNIVDLSGNIGNYVVDNSGVKFTDSGILNSNYNNNEDYSVIFDMGGNNVCAIRFNNFEFEHSSNYAYDRLNIRASNNNDIPNENEIVEFKWMKKLINSDYSTTNFIQYSGDDYPGWILPKTISEAEDINDNIILENEKFDNTCWYIIDSRYIKFKFISDTSVTKAGWDIDIYPINKNNISHIKEVEKDTPIYISNTDYSYVDTSGNISIGVVLDNNNENDKILALIN